MKKILIINGSLRNGGQTERAIDLFVGKLGAGFETEVVNLKGADIKGCIGCAVCLSQGEEFCPLKDGRDGLLGKMDAADGIVFATPNFALQVPHLMKNFLDRHAFVFHRPRFFKQTFTSIVTQGAFGGAGINKLFKVTAGFWGGAHVPGVVLTLVSAAYNPARPWSVAETAQAEARLSRLAARFSAALERKERPAPSLFRVAMFRVTRTSHKYGGQDNKDARHFRDKGWFEAGYWYPVRLGWFKSAVGGTVDVLARRLIFKK